MTKDIIGKESNPEDVYADIIDLPHWQSPARPHMSRHDRAAQFSPFAALSGYDVMIAEEAREVDSRAELDDDAAEELDRELRLIADRIEHGEKPKVTITRFFQDSAKDGGRYETVTERVRQIDWTGKRLILERKTGVAGMDATLDIGDILELHEM